MFFLFPLWPFFLGLYFICFGNQTFVFPPLCKMCFQNFYSSIGCGRGYCEQSQTALFRHWCFLALYVHLTFTTRVIFFMLHSSQAAVLFYCLAVCYIILSGHIFSVGCGHLMKFVAGGLSGYTIGCHYALGWFWLKVLNSAICILIDDFEFLLCLFYSNLFYNI